jgi:hypothetical protein
MQFELRVMLARMTMIRTYTAFADLRDVDERPTGAGCDEGHKRFVVLAVCDDFVFWGKNHRRCRGSLIVDGCVTRA